MRLSLFFTALLLWLWVAPLWSQRLLQTFPLDQAPPSAGFYVPYEDDKGTAHLFLYPKRFDLRVLYLDQDFNLLEDVIVQQADRALDEFAIVGLLDKADSLIIVAQFVGKPHYSMLLYDKGERSLKRTGLKIPYQRKNFLLDPVFEQGTFTSVQIARQGADIIVNRSSDAYSLQSDTFSVAVSDLYNKLYRNDDLSERLNTDFTIRPSLITSTVGNSLFSNVMDHKIYLYGSKLHLSFEDLENRTIRHIEIDLISKQQRLTDYPLPRINNEALWQASSLVYEDWLLLSTYQTSGWKLAIYSFGEADPIQTYEFKREVEMDAYFLPTNVMLNRFYGYLNRSLIMSLAPTKTGDFTLVIGSLPPMTGNTVMEATHRAGIDYPHLRGIFQPDALASNLPASAYSYTDQYRNFVYRVGTLAAEDLSLISPAQLPSHEVPEELGALNQSLYHKMSSFLMQEQSYRLNADAQLTFPFAQGLIKAFATRDGEMRLYYFE